MREVEAAQSPFIDLSRSAERRRRRVEDSGGGGELDPFVFGGPHFDGRSLSAVVAPMTFGALQALAETARVANENLVIGSSDGTHFITSRLESRN